MMKLSVDYVNILIEMELQYINLSIQEDVLVLFQKMLNIIMKIQNY